MESPPGAREKFILGLFTTPENYELAKSNLTEVLNFCDPSEVSLLEFDVAQLPEIAEIAKVLATPTLIRYWPRPRLRITGDLSDITEVRRLLVDLNHTREDVYLIHTKHVLTDDNAKVAQLADPEPREQLMA